MQAAIPRTRPSSSTPRSSRAAGALDRLEAFASLNGPAFYGLAPNSDTITLRREAWSVPASYPYLGEDPLVPLRAGEQVGWKLAGGG